MYNYLKHFDIPTLVICTKEDKIAKGKIQKHIKNIKEKLDLIQMIRLLVTHQFKIQSSNKYGI